MLDKTEMTVKRSDGTLFFFTNWQWIVLFGEPEQPYSTDDMSDLVRDAQGNVHSILAVFQSAEDALPFGNRLSLLPGVLLEHTLISEQTLAYIQNTLANPPAHYPSLDTLMCTSNLMLSDYGWINHIRLLYAMGKMVSYQEMLKRILASTQTPYAYYLGITRLQKQLPDSLLLPTLLSAAESSISFIDLYLYVIYPIAASNLCPDNASIIEMLLDTLPQPWIQDMLIMLLHTQFDSEHDVSVVREILILFIDRIELTTLKDLIKNQSHTQVCQALAIRRAFPPHDDMPLSFDDHFDTNMKSLYGHLSVLKITQLLYLFSGKDRVESFHSVPSQRFFGNVIALGKDTLIAANVAP